MKARLLLEERAMKEEEMSGAAILVQKKGRNFVCYYCGKPGHVEPKCFKKLPDEKAKG